VSSSKVTYAYPFAANCWTSVVLPHWRGPISMTTGVSASAVTIGLAVNLSINWKFISSISDHHTVQFGLCQRLFRIISSSISDLYLVHLGLKARPIRIQKEFYPPLPSLEIGLDIPATCSVSPRPSIMAMNRVKRQLRIQDDASQPKSCWSGSLACLRIES